MPADLTPIDELDRSILTLCTRINAATDELLVMIREFDERAGFVQWGLSCCAEWLAWRCDLRLTTAREKVRLAHALKHLPRHARAFSSGELSYAKVRALTRVAHRGNEEALLAFALRHTAVTVAERCLENLLLLCTKHHTLLHEGRYRIEKDFLDNRAFFRPDGIAVPEVGYAGVPVIGSDAHAPAGALLTAMENRVSEGPPPQYLH